MLKLITMNLIYLLRLNPNPPSDFLKVSSPHPVLIFFFPLSHFLNHVVAR